MTSLHELAPDRAQPVALLLLPALSQRPGHGAQHAFLEREMIQHVVYSGWLVRKLKRPEMPRAEGTEGLAGYPATLGSERC